MLVGGLKSKKSKAVTVSRRHHGRQMRGGYALTPADFESLGGSTTIPANYAKMPDTFPSNQVGGGY